jgi:hypothetical protein
MALKDVFLGKQNATVRDTGTQMVLDLGAVPEGYRALADKLIANNDSAVLKIQHSVTKEWQVSIWQLWAGTPNFLAKNDVNNAPLDSSNSGLYLTLVAGDSYIVESVAYPAKFLSDSNGIVDAAALFLGAQITHFAMLISSSETMTVTRLGNQIYQHDALDTLTATVILSDNGEFNTGKLHIINPATSGNISVTVGIVGKTLTNMATGAVGNRTIQAGGYAEILKDVDGNFILINGVNVV